MKFCELSDRRMCMKKSLLVLALSGFINSAYASTYAPVPEADSNALMLTGIVMLGLIIRKKLS